MAKQKILIVIAAVIILLLLLLLYLLWDKGKNGGGGGGTLTVDYDLPPLEGESGSVDSLPVVESNGGDEGTVQIDDPGLWQQVPQLLNRAQPLVLV